MDYFEILNNIKNILIENGFQELAEEVDDAQLSGGTFGERLILVYVELLEIKQKNKKAFYLIKKDSDNLFDYAHSFGYYPKIR